jgi:DNA-binding response OmpR family regulator
MKILAIDDEEANLGIIKINLERNKYEVILAKDGREGLQILGRNPKNIDIILLDRMMPNMGGMEFLKAIKENELYKDIPVIMQTAAASTEQIIQGIEGGVFYYLTKPFDSKTLISIVNSAAREVMHIREMLHDIEQKLIVSDIMYMSEFRIQSPEQARRLGIYLGNLCKKPNQVSIGYGISELLLNSIEHGNLDIGYNLKNDLLKMSEKHFKDEVERRLALSENKDKFVNLIYTKNGGDMEIIITDCGQGFKHKKYMDFDTYALHEPNGRGVPMAKVHCKNIMFNEKGNQVKIIVSDH